MSDKDRSKDDDDGGGGNGGGVGGGGGSGDDDDGEGRKIPKRVPLFRLRKGGKMMGERRREEGIYVNSGCWWRRRRRKSKIPGCFMCLKEPETLDSSGEPPTSDPSSSKFTFNMLRDLIENNDFYSKDCNTHLD